MNNGTTANPAAAASVNASHQSRFLSFEGQMTCTLPVAAEAVGRIIGKGGRRISEIRKQTGTRVHISPAEEMQTERQVSVSGTRSGVEKAIGLIQELQNCQYLSHPYDYENGVPAYVPKPMSQGQQMSSLTHQQRFNVQGNVQGLTSRYILQSQQQANLQALFPNQQMIPTSATAGVPYVPALHQQPGYPSAAHTTVAPRADRKGKKRGFTDAPSTAPPVKQARLDGPSLHTVTPLISPPTAIAGVAYEGAANQLPPVPVPGSASSSSANTSSFNSRPGTAAAGAGVKNETSVTGTNGSRKDTAASGESQLKLD